MNLRLALRAHKFRKKWDPAEIEWALAHIPRGGVALDVGAHKGGWTYWLRKAVGASGRVLAFEPQPELFAYLQRVLSGRYWRNVQVAAAALSDEQGPAHLYVPSSGVSANASLVPSVAGASALPQSASMDTLDRCLAAERLAHVDFIKVDVEGAELRLLQGAQETLRALNATWLIEAEARHIGESGVLELFEQMNGAGYTAFFFLGAQATPIEQFRFDQHQARTGERYWDKESYCNNFLFVKAGHA